VVVLGGANIDVVASAHPLHPGISNRGTVRIGAGGAGRNVAANLARLGIRTAFIGAVGDDPLSDRVVASTAQAGVDISGVTRVARSKNIYVAMITAGLVQWAVADMTAAESLTPGHIRAHASAIRAADAVVIDANLTPQAIAAACDLAAGRTLCLLPVSPAKASRIAPYLEAASCIVLSAAELQVLAGSAVLDSSDAARAVGTLRRKSGLTTVVTMDARGLVWVGREVFPVPVVPPVSVLNPSGAGDAVAAAALYGILAGFSERETARLALAAGVMTVTVDDSTHPDLSLKTLHAHAQLAIDR
jgi:pseudouridine kinase